MKKKQKIGLVLGGGGGKGAYQIGVWRALREYKIEKYIRYISATSIGSLNTLLFITGDLEKSVDIWGNINKDVALTRKNFKSIFAKKSLYSREGFIALANEYVDFTKVSNSKIQSWVTATPVSKNVKGAPTHFKLNGKSKDEILNIVLASSAMPIAFEPVYINGVKYRDGYMVDNTPVKILKEEGCKLIFVVPLREYSNAYEFADENTMIIDFVSGYNDYGIIDGTLDFVGDRAKMRMNHGYEVAKQLIEQLINDGIIAMTWKQKIRSWFIRFKKRKENKRYYYSLEKDKIKHKPE